MVTVTLTARLRNRAVGMPSTSDTIGRNEREASSRTLQHCITVFHQLLSNQPSHKEAADVIPRFVHKSISPRSPPYAPFRKVALKCFVFQAFSCAHGGSVKRPVGLNTVLTTIQYSVLYWQPAVAFVLVPPHSSADIRQRPARFRRFFLVNSVLSSCCCMSH